jgi:hypothetical protein
MSAPDKLFFVPNVPRFEASDDFRQDILQHIVAPCIIYKVHDQDYNHVGNVELIDDFVASSHGDDMAFQHQSISSITVVANGYGSEAEPRSHKYLYPL